MRKFLSWLLGPAITIHVQAIRKRERTGSSTGGRPYKLSAIVNGRVICMQYLASAFSPSQYELQLSKLLAKIYRRYRWLVRRVVHLPSFDPLR